MKRANPASCKKCSGASLVVALLMLVVVMMLGAAAAQVALQGEKSSRSERDRQVAFQAAEAALLDAEIDIESSQAGNSRSDLFKEKGLESHQFVSGCGRASSGHSFGLCQPSAFGQAPVWLEVDFSDDSASSARAVPYGYFTGQSMQVRVGSAPAKLPRYIIEIFRYNEAGASANNRDATFFFRVTAVGFGMKEATRVVLQTFYRKIEKIG